MNTISNEIKVIETAVYEGKLAHNHSDFPHLFTLLDKILSIHKKDNIIQVLQAQIDDLEYNVRWLERELDDAKVQG